MEKPVVSLYDKKAETFSSPFFPTSQGVAMREFQDVVNKPDDNSLVFKHPEDFDLYVLGTWDDSTAQFTCDGAPKLLMTGLSAKTE